MAAQPSVGGSQRCSPAASASRRGPFRSAWAWTSLIGSARRDHPRSPGRPDRRRALTLVDGSITRGAGIVRLLDDESGHGALVGFVAGVVRYRQHDRGQRGCCSGACCIRVPGKHRAGRVRAVERSRGAGSAFRAMRVRRRRCPETRNAGGAGRAGRQVGLSAALLLADSKGVRDSLAKLLERSSLRTGAILRVSVRPSKLRDRRNRRTIPSDCGS
jgi:hypothetical protein